jgi:hypothetical protein
MWEKIIRIEQLTTTITIPRVTEKFTFRLDEREYIKKADWDFFWLNDEYGGREIGCYQKVWKNKLRPKGDSKIKIDDFFQFQVDVLKEVFEKKRNGCNFFYPIQGEMDLDATEKSRREGIEKKKMRWMKIGVVVAIITTLAIIAGLIL